ncbi:MAG: septal ring lytic transglycosylase RlpA family protein [Microbacteriaceae bacterium]|nr:septal ring lytic transglycosylase RlpA family protein [Burkholderiaceae bacterium]
MTPPARLLTAPSPRPAPPGQRWLGLIGLAALAALAALAGLAGCTSGPPPGPTGGGVHLPAARPSPSIAAPHRSVDFDRDGPGLHPPPDLDQVPDAQPQLEAVRPGGPNKPYAVLGQPYTPLAGDPSVVERGLASWYGNKFHGRSTANGETYNMYAMTAAHKTMPLPSYARVRNPANGREVVVRVNDRGPFHADRLIDLSYTAALKLGVLGGVAAVEIERITYEAIRTGSWRVPANPLAGRSADPTADPPNDPSYDPIAEIARRYATAPAGPAGLAGLAADTPATGLAAVRPPAQPTAQPSALPLPVETTAPARAAAKATPGFWLQLGAFGQRDGAVGFQQRVAREAGWLAPLLTIFNERHLHRLQAGPYASRADASAAAARLRDTLQLVPAMVERQ